MSYKVKYCFIISFWIFAQYARPVYPFLLPCQMAQTWTSSSSLSMNRWTPLLLHSASGFLFFCKTIIDRINFVSTDLCYSICDLMSKKMKLHVLYTRSCNNQYLLTPKFASFRSSPPIFVYLLHVCRMSVASLDCYLHSIFSPEQSGLIKIKLWDGAGTIYY